jgi:hypothetical protein
MARSARLIDCRELEPFFFLLSREKKNYKYQELECQSAQLENMEAGHNLWSKQMYLKLQIPRIRTSKCTT